MANKKQAQAQAQAQAHETISEVAIVAQETAQETALTTSNFIDKMLSCADLDDIENRKITVGEKELSDLTLKKVVVTAETINAFSKVSAMALCCELGKVDKETAKHDGFKVNAFIEKALPDISPAQARRYYVIGRLFGDPNTHEWRRPIVSSVTFTALDIVAKAFCNCEKLDEATEKDRVARFDEFVAKYIKTGKLHLNGTIADLKQEIADLKSTVINSTAQEIKGNEAQGNEAQGNEAPAKAQETETAREAINALYAYFKGNVKVQEYLALILAEIPTETETETEAQETEAQETETEAQAQ